MATPRAIIQHCTNGKGWCVEAAQESCGPMETEAEANRYLQLLNRVSAARTQVACTEEICWQA